MTDIKEKISHTKWNQIVTAKTTSLVINRKTYRYYNLSLYFLNPGCLSISQTDIKEVV